MGKRDGEATAVIEVRVGRWNTSLMTIGTISNVVVQTVCGGGKGWLEAS
jgi:hypothetical protein